MSTVAKVRSRSWTGEFDSLADAIIAEAIAEVAGQYRTIVAALGIETATKDLLVALHAAHLLHLGLKQEAGGDDLPGPIKSETLNRVGSRSYGSAAKLDGVGGIVDWQDSIYGHRHQSIWAKLPPGICTVPPAL